MFLDFTQPPSKKLFQTVRAGFIAQDSSLSTWCKQNGINLNYATHSLCGSTDGPKSKIIRNKIIADLQKLDKETSQ